MQAALHFCMLWMLCIAVVVGGGVDPPPLKIMSTFPTVSWDQTEMSSKELTVG